MARSSQNSSAPAVEKRQLRWGLCCGFAFAPIKFRTTTARYINSLPPAAAKKFLQQIAIDNSGALMQAIEWCAAHDIGAFRVNSEILPLYTHATLGYSLDELDSTGAITLGLVAARVAAERAGIRLSFHPDQFVVPGSLREEVVQSSIDELEYQALIAELIGAEQITLHGGGAQGGKPEALERLRRGLNLLSPRARQRLVLENDDRVYTVADLLPFCTQEKIPLVYDVHHHRCHPDEFSIAEATQAAAETWRGREPWVHISSPLGGWSTDAPRTHADYIDAADVPIFWRNRAMTIDVEAKAKELAVLQLRQQFGAQKKIAKKSRSRKSSVA